MYARLRCHAKIGMEEIRAGMSIAQKISKGREMHRNRPR